MTGVLTTIRRYRPVDRNPIIALHLRTLKAAGFDVSGGNRSQDLNDIETCFLDSGGEFLVAEQADVIVGMGGLTRLDDRTVKLRRMRVEPALQRCGIGTKLLHRLETRAVELGVIEIVLDTSILLIGAQSFYTRHGYSETHREGSGDDTLIYYQKLPVRSV